MAKQTVTMICVAKVVLPRGGQCSKTVIKLKSDFAGEDVWSKAWTTPAINYSGISFVDRHVATTSAPTVSFIVTAHVANMKRAGTSLFLKRLSSTVDAHDYKAMRFAKIMTWPRRLTKYKFITYCSRGRFSVGQNIIS